MENKINQILKILPDNIKNVVCEAILSKKEIEEIRIKEDAPVIIYLADEEITSKYIATKEDIIKIISNITRDSLYAYLEEIKKGYITIEGGHRVGICGTAVYENEKLINIKDLSCINIRVAKEIKGVSNNIIKYIYDGIDIKNTLVISPPGEGKTTLIRDITRALSENKNIKIAVIDERDEIASVYKGKAQNDIGIRTFVLSGYSKKDGFMHSIRSLSPTVIVCDEIGSFDDVLSVKNAVNKGVKVITTIHGYSVSDISKKEEFKELINYFECVITIRNHTYSVEKR